MDAYRRGGRAHAAARSAGRRPPAFPLSARYVYSVPPPHEAGASRARARTVSSVRDVPAVIDTNTEGNGGLIAFDHVIADPAITVRAYDAPAESLGLLHDQVVADRIVCPVNRDTGRSTAADLDQVPHTIAADLHASRQDRNKGVIAGVNPDWEKIRGMIVSENTIHDVVNNVDTAGRVNSGRAVRIRKAAGICHDIAADDAADTRQPDAVPSVLRETIVLDNIAGSRRVGGNIDTVRKTLDRAVANGDQGIASAPAPRRQLTELPPASSHATAMPVAYFRMTLSRTCDVLSAQWIPKPVVKEA